MIYAWKCGTHGLSTSGFDTPVDAALGAAGHLQAYVGTGLLCAVMVTCPVSEQLREYALDGAAWLTKHAGHVLSHNERGFLCRTCSANAPSASERTCWLTATAWNDSVREIGHHCKPPLGNPTREEAMLALDRVRTHTMSVIDVLNGTMSR